jgi:Na+-driven multidrug efflux pump
MSIVRVANIGLNFLLVFHTTIGYKGIALSTVISVFIGCIFNLWYMRPFLSGIKKFSMESAKAIINIGWLFGLGQVL